MSQSNTDLAKAFIGALSAGRLPDDLLTDDMTAWTTSSGADSGKTRYQGGVQLLASIFKEIDYVVDSTTAEGDRVAIEARMNGVLNTGEAFANRYVFMLRVRDGRIASVAEHFNPAPVFEKIVPLLREAMAKPSAR
jgi:ketosteroid isomerase-like protein